MKIKILFIATIALVLLASCSGSDFVGDKEALNAAREMPISFGSTTPTLTRADKTGDAAATDLNNNFVIFGYKTVSSTPQTVFDNYQVNFVTNTAGTTESNSANWEYVSYKNLPFGTTTASGGVLNTDGVTKNATASSTNIEQSIKYWDFGATQYDFFAYSLGVGEPDDADADTDPQYAKASAITNSTYTLEGNANQLGACYISSKNTLTALSPSATEVELAFRSFYSKVQLGFYETIPGYSVKEVKFYPSATDAATTTPSLYASDVVLPNGGKYTITFDANGIPQVSLAGDPTPTKISKIDFSESLTPYAGFEYKEAAANYLGRTSSAATLTDIINVLPNPANVNALNIKMDFTLVSRDGTGETINMTGATAVIPAAYAQWQPNYKYTYIFKISDNTNAQSGSVTGLYPITLDAVITDAQDGSQETVTTVATPSITTYAKASDVLHDNEYKTGANIYVVVNNGEVLTVGTNANLYTATVEDGAVQGITEETVKNAIATNSDGGYDIGEVLEYETPLVGYYTFDSGTSAYAACAADDVADGTTTYYKKAAYSVKDANGKKLVIKNATGLTAITEIPVADSPAGIAITVKGAKFTPAAIGTYVIEYIDGESNKYYKVIKVISGS